jgi:hypothetical protein
MQHVESSIQREGVKLVRVLYPRLTLFSVPNGGRRGKVEAAIMKGEGTLAGVADLFLMAKTGRYAGLFIEVKAPDGRQSTAQKEFEQKAEKAGYCYRVCRSAAAIVETVAGYLAT